MMDIISLPGPSSSYDNCIITCHSESDSSLCIDSDDDKPFLTNVPNTQDEFKDDLENECTKIANAELCPQVFFNYILGTILRVEFALEQSDQTILYKKKWIRKQIFLLKTVFLKNENMFFKPTNSSKRDNSRKSTKVKKGSTRDTDETRSNPSVVIQIDNPETITPNENFNRQNKSQSQLITPKSEPCLNTTPRRSQRISNRKDAEVILCDKLMYTTLKMQRYTSTPIIPVPTFREVEMKDLKNTKKRRNSSKSTNNKGTSKLQDKGAANVNDKNKTPKSLLKNLSNEKKKIQKPFQKKMKAKSLSDINAIDKTSKNLRNQTFHGTLGHKLNPADRHLNHEIPGPSGINSVGKNCTKVDSSESSIQNSKSTETRKKAPYKRRAKSLERGKTKKAKKNEEKSKSRHTIIFTEKSEFNSSSSSNSGKRKLYDPETWLHSLSMMNQDPL